MVRAINDLIHNEYESQGKVKDSIAIPTLQQVNTAQADLQNPLTWKEHKGDVAKIGDNYFSISDSDSQGNIRLIALNSPERTERYINSYHINGDNTAIYESMSMDVGVGDKVRFRISDKERIVANNSIGVITGTENGKLQIDVNGKTVNYDPTEQISDRHLTLAYASTVHSSQGANAQYVIGAFPKSANSFLELDSFYVAISRGKEHIQVIADDLNGLVDKIWLTGKGERATTLDLLENRDIRLNETRTNEILIRERAEWDRSIPLNAVKGKDNLPISAVENGRYFAERSELLFPVTNEDGNHRGNLHIPFNLRQGKFEYEEAYYTGASDGSIAVMNRGDEQEKIQEYSLSELKDAVLSDKDAETVVLKLNNASENGTEIDKVEQDHTKEFIVETKAQEAIEQKVDNEIAQEKNSAKVEDTDKLDSIMQREHSEIEYLEKSIQQDKEIDQKQDSFARLGNDEANVIRHTDEDKEVKPTNKVQEKELV